jgi:hypothetical protein
MQIPGIGDQTQQPAPTQGQPSPLDIPSAIEQTIQQQQTPPVQTPSMSQPVTPQEGQQLTISFPGALSSWRKEGAFGNGDTVRINITTNGQDDRGTTYQVPRNKIGEVIWSDDTDTIVIFSLESGPLGPHNIKVTAPTQVFSLMPRGMGQAPRRRR